MSRKQWISAEDGWRDFCRNGENASIRVSFQVYEARAEWASRDVDVETHVDLGDDDAPCAQQDG